MKLTRIALVALAAMTLAGVAQAQDMKFGGQLTLSKPQGDLDTLMDGKMGYGLGLNMLIDLKGGHAIVPRFDYATFKRTVDVAEVKWTTMSLGADYNYFVSGKANDGFYLGVGLGYTNGKIEASFAGLSGDESKSAITYGAGLGYMFTPNLGAELKYNSAKFSFDGEDVSAPTINVSFIFRF